MIINSNINGLLQLATIRLILLKRQILHSQCLAFKNFIILIAGITCLSAFTDDSFDRCKELKKELTQFRSGKVGETAPFNDHKKTEALQNKYNTALRNLLHDTFTEPDFIHAKDSLWNRMLKDNDFNVIIINETLKNISQQELLLDKDDIIESMIQHIDTSENITINTKNFLIANDKYSILSKNVMDKLIKKLCSLDTVNPILIASFEKNNSSVNEILQVRYGNLDKIPLRAEDWILLAILSKNGKAWANEKLLKYSTNEYLKKLCDNRNLILLNLIPMCLAFSENKESISRLKKLLKVDYHVNNGDDAIPKVTQVSHIAAFSLFRRIKNFPKFNKYFADDKELLKCIDWFKNNPKYETKEYSGLDFYNDVWELGLQ